MIESDERSIGLGLDLDFPLAAIRPLERVSVTRCEYGVPVNDYLAIFLLDREKLVARALAQSLWRFVGLMDVRRLRRKWKRCDNGNACLDTGLPKRWKEPYFVDRIQSDPLGNVAQKSLGGLYHARAVEV